MEVRHQGDKEETFIQTSRRGGDGQPGQRGLPARQWLADPERGRIVEPGRQCNSSQTPRPHIRAQINQEERWGAKQSAQPRAPAPGNKASNL